MSHPLLTPAKRRILTLDLTEFAPEIGTVYLRSLTAQEKVRYELGNREKYGSPEWARAEESRSAELLVLTVCDATGQPLLTATDAIALAGQDGRVIQILVEAVYRHCGLQLSQGIFAAIADAEKKSLTTG